MYATMDSIVTLTIDIFLVVSGYKDDFHCFRFWRLQMCTYAAMDNIVTSGSMEIISVMKYYQDTQRLQKLIYLYLSTDCFVFQWREIFTKQSVDKYR